MIKKTIISGNKNYGLGMALSQKVPGADFFSRSCGGYDFSKHEARVKFAELSCDYEVYISCSCLAQFRQTLLLEAVYQKWLETGKSGYIICLGSSADATVKGTQWLYPIEKKALRDYCRNLSLATLGGHGSKPTGIRITYLSPGYLQTSGADKKHPDVQKIDLDYMAELIQWLIQQPPNINISHMGLDPIQGNL